MVAPARSINLGRREPASLIFGPSAHQIGSAPSQTRVGVQVKAVPVATMEAKAMSSMGTA
jgi:hypothetical protein